MDYVIGKAQVAACNTVFPLAVQLDEFCVLSGRAVQQVADEEDLGPVFCFYRD